MAISAFSNLSITSSDGGTVPSLDYLSKKTFVNIGSGNVFKITWNTPTATNNKVDSYKLTILYYDTTSGSYKTLYDANIGHINEFYVKSSLFDKIQQAFTPIHIYVEAISTYGSTYNGTSNIVSVNVSRGCGTYVSVSDGYKQPILKRAIAFSRLPTRRLLTSEGAALSDSNIVSLIAKETSNQSTDTGWTLMQEFYLNDQASYKVIDDFGRELIDANNDEVYISAAGLQLSDIRYEILVDANGEIITDPYGSDIYTL